MIHDKIRPDKINIVCTSIWHHVSIQQIDGVSVKEGPIEGLATPALIVKLSLQPEYPVPERRILP
ncbi:hypothetical protein DPMN_139892 [Dreissena polymorpha]|uniref:Uncharacterized protein n=1 Tax=Dreissena polymorpha TaxID=45954 RepID=A0A9D4G748_DREPO|nr:hypothetical protein DPMN_139892 [Dreissena polymorpha]